MSENDILSWMCKYKDSNDLCNNVDCDTLLCPYKKKGELEDCPFYTPSSDDFDPVRMRPVDDQSIKADAGKPKLTLVPQQIIFDIAKVREYGLKKYGTSESWKDVDIQRYRDATYRHFLAYLKDPQGIDEESGLTHLSHLACNIAFLCELENDKKGK